MAATTKPALALKEWAAVIGAMERGDQLVTLRKGGIREKAFLLEGRTFYLLPTFEHQAESLVKPEFRATLPEAIAAQRDEAGLAVRARADVVDAWEIDDADRLAALAPYHMFTEDYARRRFGWRPKQPLTVLFLKVFRLAEPWSTGLPAGVGGCRSWIEIDAATAPQTAEPALSEAGFNAKRAEIRRVLGSALKPAATR